MVNLKLVGAQTYVGPRTGNNIVRKGEVYGFKDEDAEAVLAEVQYDSANNAKPIFAVVEDEDRKSAAKGRVARRRAA